MPSNLLCSHLFGNLSGLIFECDIEMYKYLFSVHNNKIQQHWNWSGNVGSNRGATFANIGQVCRPRGLCIHEPTALWWCLRWFYERSSLSSSSSGVPITNFGVNSSSSARSDPIPTPLSLYLTVALNLPSPVCGSFQLQWSFVNCHHLYLE